mmetsp:Transcript_7671/g.16949  ORF Transcript_7671/g.16949 Transcript_7671/m.16949 type:complete len:554 (+) Transcript_7671:139-1800(+)
MVWSKASVPLRTMTSVLGKQMPVISTILSSSVRAQPCLAYASLGIVRKFSTHHPEEFYRRINPQPDLGKASALSLYQSKGITELARAFVSLSICQWRWLVSNAEVLFKVSQSISKKATERILEQTLYGHFCAGQDEHRIQPTMERLNTLGIGSILDYAAELDEATSTSSPSSQAAMEENFERNTEDFKKSIRAVSTMGQRGSCAVHLTAVCSPQILERFSNFLAQWQQLFESRMDDKGQVSEDQAKALLRQLYNQKTADKMSDRLVENGVVDVLSWTSLMEPEDFADLCPSTKVGQPLDVLNAEELDALMAFYRRGHELATEAKAMGTTLFVDAEHVRYQLAIDHLVWVLQRKYNATVSTSYPVVHGTFQCYRTDAFKRVHTDIQRSEKFNYHFGAKIVRGAMMESEREYALANGIQSPIHDTLDDTNDCYNHTVEFLVHHAAAVTTQKKTEVLFATHNKESILRAIDAMNKYGIDRSDGTIAFGQLYGMSDAVTHALAENGYKVSKYLPYGEVEVSMPYLIRRAVENSSLASGATEELSLIRDELRRRIVGF